MTTGVKHSTLMLMYILRALEIESAHDFGVRSATNLKYKYYTGQTWRKKCKRK